MSATHTPGPWAWTEAPGRPGRPVLLAGNGRRVLTIDRRTVSPWEADAALIALSPELLAAVEALFPPDQWELCLATLQAGDSLGTVEATLICRRDELLALRDACIRARAETP